MIDIDRLHSVIENIAPLERGAGLTFSKNVQLVQSATMDLGYLANYAFVTKSNVNTFYALNQFERVADLLYKDDLSVVIVRRRSNKNLTPMYEVYLDDKHISNIEFINESNSIHDIDSSRFTNWFIDEPVICSF